MNSTAVRSFVFSLSLTVALRAQDREDPEPLFSSRHFFGSEELNRPRAGGPREIALSYLEESADDLGVAAPDVEGLELTRIYASEHNGVTHLFFQQRVAGIDVFGATVRANITSDHRILSVASQLFPDAFGSFNTLDPALPPETALGGFAEKVGIPRESQTIELVEDIGGPSRRLTLKLDELAAKPIPVELKLVAMGQGDLRLAWSLQITLKDLSDAFEVFIDASDGTEIARQSHRADAAPQYKVLPLGVESPAHGAEATVTEPTDSVTVCASQSGWVTGTTTLGNNVTAYEGSVGGYQPSDPQKHFLCGSEPALTLAYLDSRANIPELSEYKCKAVTNLFYTCNLLHDIFYQYGFNEVAGNFQTNNFGRGGAGADAVKAFRLGGTGAGAELRLNPCCDDGTAPELVMGEVDLLDVYWTDAVAPTANKAVAILAAEADNSGGLDLITANEISNNVSLFRSSPPNSGQFLFAGNRALPAGSGPVALAAADFDDDGDLDVAVANKNTNSVTVLWRLWVGIQNPPSATSTQISLSGGTQPRAIIAADFDFDGAPDLAVVNYASNNVNVLRGTYSTQFQNAGTLSLPGHGTALVGAKLDTDTDYKADLAVTSAVDGTLAGKLSLFRNTSSAGSISFAQGVHYDLATDSSLGRDPSSITASDFDVDGKIDLGVANQASNTVSLFKNASGTGSLSFSLQALLDVGKGPRSITAVATHLSGYYTIPLKLDQDNTLPDLLVVNSTSETLSVRMSYMDDVPWLFSIPHTALNPNVLSVYSDLPLGPDYFPYAVVAGDFNGDPRIDAAVAFATNPATVGVFLGQENGGLGEAIFQNVGAGVPRDNAIDKSYVAHEFSHGVHYRLAGGKPSFNRQGHGLDEGFSDFFGLVMTQTPAAPEPRGIGTFWKGEPPDGPGIRSFRYSTHNPLTFEDYNDRRIGGPLTGVTHLSSPHAFGEIWAATLWDIYWKLCDPSEYGRSNDLYRSGLDADAGGENVAMQLVIDALKLGHPDGSFVGARNDILAADQVTYGGKHLELLWSVFSARGLGWTACENWKASTSTCVPYDVSDPNLIVKEAMDLPGLGTIRGAVFHDLNQNGVRDSGPPSEPYLQGWEVFLDLNRNGRLDPDENTSAFSATAGSNGAYEITGLYPNDYSVAVALQAGWKQSWSPSVSSRPALARVGKWPSACVTDCCFVPTACATPGTGPIQYADVWGAGNFAYVGSHNNGGVDIIDISDPVNPTPAAHWSDPSGLNDIEDIEVHGGIGYFASDNGGGVYVVNVANPYAPLKIAQITAAQQGRNNVHTLTVGGNYLYIASNKNAAPGVPDPKIPVFRVSNPSSPTWVTEIDTASNPACSPPNPPCPANIHQCTVSGNRLYACSGANGYIHIYDVSTIESGAVHLGSFRPYMTDTHSCWPTANGQYLVVAKESLTSQSANEIDIWNISTLPWTGVPPNVPPTSRAAFVGLPIGQAKSAHNPVVNGNLLFVSWYEAGLLVFDITNALTPVGPGRYDTHCGTLGGNFKGNWGVYPFLGPDRILLSDTETGLYVLSLARTHSVTIHPNGMLLAEGKDFGVYQ